MPEDIQQLRPDQALYWEWEERYETPKLKREGWRKLRWTMTERRAEDWAAHEGVVLRKVPNSAKVRWVGGAEGPGPGAGDMICGPEHRKRNP